MKLTIEKLLQLTTTYPKGNTFFSECLKAVRGFDNVSKIIEIDDNLINEAKKTRKALLHEFGESIQLPNAAYSAAMEKEIDIPISDCSFLTVEYIKELNPDQDTMRVINLIRPKEKK